MKAVALLGGGAGAGRTTLAANLAVLAAAEGLVVLLVDAGGGDLAGWWRRRLAAGVERPPLGFRRCPPGRLGGRALRARYSLVDLVLVDAPGDAGRRGAAAVARACDLALVPVVPARSANGRFDAGGVAPAAALLREAGRPFATVLSRCPPRGGGTGLPGGAAAGAVAEAARVALEGLGAAACPAPVRARPEVARAAEGGLAVAEARPLGLAAAELRGVWEWLRGELPLPLRRPSPTTTARARRPRPGSSRAGGGGAAWTAPGGLAPGAWEALGAIAARRKRPRAELLHEAVEGLAAAYDHRAPLERASGGASAAIAAAAASDGLDALLGEFAEVVDRRRPGPAVEAAAAAVALGAFVARLPPGERFEAAAALLRLAGGCGRRAGRW